MSKLKAVVQELSAALPTACPTQQLKSLKLDDGQLVLSLVDADDRSVVLNLVYIDADSYPRSGALIQVDEDRSSCSASTSERLGAVSERFQDSAALSAVLSKVCAVLDIPVDEDALRAAEKRARATDTDGPGSNDMQEDASDDPMSEDYPASSSGGSEEGDLEADYELDKEVMVECGQRQGRWNRFEEELAAASATEQVLSMDQGRASKQQIFSSQEAFQMVSNELLGFIRRQMKGEDTNLSADSVGDDLYTWDVQLWKTAFRPDCQLAKDLQEVSSKFAVSSIQLRFTFMRGLHPFYPPRLEVVRPHLANPLPGALASYPLLRLEHWDPTLTMTEVLDNIRTFLEEHGSIDVSDARNSAAQFPGSAFSPVQVALARLEAMTDVKPACYSRYKSVYQGRSTQGRVLEATEMMSPGGAEVPSPTSTQVSKKPRTNNSSTAPDAAAEGAAAGVAGALTGAAAAAAAAAVGGAAQNVVWKKGTGYGYGYNSSYGATKSTARVWDPKAAAAAQEAQDEQLNSVLQALAAALRQEFPNNSSSGGDAGGASSGTAAGGGSSKAAGPNSSSSSSGRGRGQQQQQGGGQQAADALTPEQQKCMESLHDSVLRPLLARELAHVAFQEMVDRQAYYKPLLTLVDALCQPAFDAFLAGDATAQDNNAAEAAAAAGPSSSSRAQQQQQARVCSIAGSLRGLQKGARIVQKELSKALEGQQAAASSSSRALDKHTESIQQQARLSLEVADLVISIVGKLQHLTTAEDSAAAAAAATQPAAAAAPALPARRTTRAAAAAAAAAAGSGQQQQQPEDAASRAAAYRAALSPLVLDTASISAFHKFKGEASTDSTGLKARVQKVTSEIAGIERLIEVNESSSVFVRVDEDNSFLWRTLITGPEDTPYSGGCFIFDMFFPPTYPSSPPKVLIITTGGGTVRFNPNLYNCGKVCLSLLGTWSGGQGESWDPQASSAFQVLVSIQSLILVPEPYFNEPGYEQRADHGASKNYNKVIREATIQWAMIDQLQHPPAEFAPVIKAHFRLRGSTILAQVQAWIDEAGLLDAGHKGRLVTLKGQLEAELKKLT